MLQLPTPLTSYWLMLFIFASFCASAQDVLRLYESPTGGSKGAEYKRAVLTKALEITEAEFGPFSVQASQPFQMKPDRALASIKTGKLINVAVIPANRDWAEHATAIKIPIRGGTLSYRLLFVHKDNLDNFAHISDLQDLKMLTAGLQNDWLTTSIFADLNINTITSHSFNGLFSMLRTQRIDYVPRAVYEAFEETPNAGFADNTIVIEPTLALRVPMVSFVYVSKQQPRLTERLQTGLNKLATDGELRQLFNRYYAESVERAAVGNRKIIDIDPQDSLLPYQLPPELLWPASSLGLK